MNEVLKAIAERYSCRDFKGTPLTQAQITALAEAAVAAPSAMNLQPWHVTVITDKKFIDEMDEVAMKTLAETDKAGYDRMMSRGGKIFYNAPCMVMVSSKGSPADVGILSQNVALAAHALGLGNVICGMAAIPLNGPRGEAFKKHMAFPEGYGFGMAILVGEANSTKPPHEKDMGKVTFVAG